MALLLVSPALAGCLVPETPEGTNVAGEVDWAAVEAEAPVDVTFDVTTLAGAPLVVTGHAWLPDGPVDTAVLVVHGSGGLARELFGPASVPGYSFAHHVLQSGRAAVVIDRPGYEGSTPAGTQDDHAWVLAQIAQQLREGALEGVAGGPASFEGVVAVGHSMGAHVVMIAEAEHTPFDAIVPTGWSHGGYRDGWWECLRPADDPPYDMECVLLSRNTDPAILAWAHDLVERIEENPDDNIAAWIANTGSWRSIHPAFRGVPAPDRDEVSAAKIEGPVLMLLGAEDGLAHPSTQEEEERIFTSSDDVTVVHLEDTAHWVFHHLNRDEVYKTMMGWLETRGF